MKCIIDDCEKDSSHVSIELEHYGPGYYKRGAAFTKAVMEIEFPNRIQAAKTEGILEVQGDGVYYRAYMDADKGAPVTIENIVTEGKAAGDQLWKAVAFHEQYGRSRVVWAKYEAAFPPEKPH